MTNKRGGKQKMETIFKDISWPHCNWIQALIISGSLPPLSIYLVRPLPLFWITRFQGWHTSRLTSTVRQMELRGVRQRPGKPCQLMWPQAQPYSITTSAVNIQLRRVWVLLAVSSPRCQKMTVVLETLCAWWVHVPVTLCVVGQVSLGTKAGWSSPLSQRLWHHRGCQGKCPKQLSPLWLPGWSDWLGGCSLLLHSSQSCQFTSINFPEKEEYSCWSFTPGSCLFCT